MDASGLGALYYMEQPVTAEIPKTPDPVFEPAVDYRPLLTVMGMFAAAVAGLGIWWIKKSHTTVIYVAQHICRGACKKGGDENLHLYRKAEFIRSADCRRKGHTAPDLPAVRKKQRTDYIGPYPCILQNKAWEYRRG